MRDEVSGQPAFFRQTDWQQNNWWSSKGILMGFSGNVHNGPKKRWLDFGNDLVSDGALTLDLLKITGQVQRPMGPNNLLLLLTEVTVWREMSGGLHYLSAFLLFWLEIFNKALIMNIGLPLFKTNKKRNMTFSPEWSMLCFSDHASTPEMPGHFR